VNGRAAVLARLASLAGEDDLADAPAAPLGELHTSLSRDPDPEGPGLVKGWGDRSPDGVLYRTCCASRMDLGHLSSCHWAGTWQDRDAEQTYVANHDGPCAPVPVEAGHGWSPAPSTYLLVLAWLVAAYAIALLGESIRRRTK
jgi:hypothetical protein